MDVGSLTTKGKGFGKPGTTKAPKGKGRWCHFCKSTTHDTNYCWRQQKGETRKGKSKTKGKGKGKGKRSISHYSTDDPEFESNYGEEHYAEYDQDYYEQDGWHEEAPGDHYSSSVGPEEAQQAQSSVTNSCPSEKSGVISIRYGPTIQ